MKKRYFNQPDGAPPPLTADARLRVRFEEVDILRMVWHGRYASYFEEGRRAFGDKYGFDYTFYKKMRIAAPVVKLHIDYMAPLTLDEEFHVITMMHWSDAVRFNLEFHVESERGTAATGWSVQLLTDSKGQTIILPPPWLKKFRNMWREGRLQNSNGRAWQE